MWKEASALPKSAKSERYKIVTQYLESLASPPSHEVQLRVETACLGALLPASRLEKEMREPSLSGRSRILFLLPHHYLIYGKANFISLPSVSFFNFSNVF